MAGQRSKDEYWKLKTVVTPKFRVSFPNLFQAKAFKNKAGKEEGKPKFGLTMLFSEKTDLKALKEALYYAGEEKWGPDRSKWPQLRNPHPFKNGDTKKDLAGYPGSIFVAVRSDKKPGLVDINKNPIDVPDDFYAGCYARASIVAFASEDFGGTLGFALQHVQKIADGEKFSGQKSADQVFADDLVVETEGLDVSNNTIDMGF